MGTVSGVYLKYVVLSAGFTAAGISYLTDEWKVGWHSIQWNIRRAESIDSFFSKDQFQSSVASLFKGSS